MGTLKSTAVQKDQLERRGKLGHLNCCPLLAFSLGNLTGFSLLFGSRVRFIFLEVPQNQGILQAGGVGAYTHFPGGKTESETGNLGVKVYLSQENQAFFATSSSLCLQLKAAELHSMHTLKSKSETQGNLRSQQKPALPTIGSDWLPASELTVIRSTENKAGRCCTNTPFCLTLQPGK